MTFLAIFGAAEILCSFRLTIEGKTGKKIPESSRLEFLERFSANNFVLSDVEVNRHSRFTFVENTISNMPKVLRAKFLGINELFCFISVCTFPSFKFAMITCLSELYFRIERCILLVQTKKLISMNLAAAPHDFAENHGGE